MYRRKNVAKMKGTDICMLSHTERIWHVQFCKNCLSLFGTLPIRETSKAMSWPQYRPKGEMPPGRIVWCGSSLKIQLCLRIECCSGLSLPTYWKDRCTSLLYAMHSNSWTVHAHPDLLTFHAVINVFLLLSNHKLF